MQDLLWPSFLEYVLIDCCAYPGLFYLSRDIENAEFFILDHMLNVIGNGLENKDEILKSYYHIKHAIQGENPPTTWEDFIDNYVIYKNSLPEHCTCWWKERIIDKFKQDLTVPQLLQLEQTPEGVALGAFVLDRDLFCHYESQKPIVILGKKAGGLDIKPILKKYDKIGKMEIVKLTQTANQEVLFCFETLLPGTYLYECEFRQKALDRELQDAVMHTPTRPLRDSGCEFFNTPDKLSDFPLDFLEAFKRYYLKRREILNQNYKCHLATQVLLDKHTDPPKDLLDKERITKRYFVESRHIKDYLEFIAEAIELKNNKKCEV